MFRIEIAGCKVHDYNTPIFYTYDICKASKLNFTFSFLIRKPGTKVQDCTYYNLIDNLLL